MRIVASSAWWTSAILVYSMFSGAQRLMMTRALNHSCSPRFSSKAGQEDIHLIVLVHGWMGNPQEMEYLKQALERQVPSSSTPFVKVHSAICNLDRTFDGIEAGGTRLAEEVNEILDSFRTQNQSASLSFVGNSLGGLYARYALSQIPYLAATSAAKEDKDLETCPTPTTETSGKEEDDGRNNQTQQNLDHSFPPVRAAVFCTTATPHLGVSEHTYIPLFRAAESVVATVLQSTGRDLFRYSSAIQELSTNPKFLRPLARFEHRIAHANAHQTDFQVPTSTAAFVTADSLSVHDVVRVPSELRNHKFWKLSVETRPSYREGAFSSNLKGTSEDTRETISSTKISELLDSLGWHKVFWDVRSVLIPIPLPLPSFGWDGRRNAAKSSNSDDNRKSSSYTSSELHRQFTSTDRLVLPLGHTMMVANSKNDWYARINAGGQPVMDWVAKDLLRRVLLLSSEE